METFQKLKILVEEGKKDAFFQKLTDEIERSSWVIKKDLIENYKKNTFTTSKNVLCVESEKYEINGRIIQGIVWLWDYSGYFELFNIVPVTSGHLEFKEYNYILNKFHDLFIPSLADQFNAKVEISSPERFIIDTTGAEAFHALEVFSESANKSTGNVHPYDFERWCDFVFIIFRRHIQLSATELEAWLIENGWSDDMASKLALDFEYSIDLLKKYEQN